MAAIAVDLCGVPRLSWWDPNSPLSLPPSRFFDDSWIGGSACDYTKLVSLMMDADSISLKALITTFYHTVVYLLTMTSRMFEALGGTKMSSSSRGSISLIIYSCWELKVRKNLSLHLMPVGWDSQSTWCLTEVIWLNFLCWWLLCLICSPLLCGGHSALYDFTHHVDAGCLPSCSF